MFYIQARIITTVFAMALLIGLPALGHAEPDKEKGMHRDAHSEHDPAAHQFVNHTFHSLFHHAKDLGLTEEQMAKLKTMLTDYEKVSIRGEADLKVAEVDVQALAHDEKAEMTAIESAVRKSEAAHANLRIEGIKAVRAAYAVLTPEQKEKLRSSRSMGHGEGKGKGDYEKRDHEGKSDAPKGGMK